MITCTDAFVNLTRMRSAHLATRKNLTLVGQAEWDKFINGFEDADAGELEGGQPWEVDEDDLYATGLCVDEVQMPKLLLMFPSHTPWFSVPFFLLPLRLLLLPTPHFTAFPSLLPHYLSVSFFPF